MLWFELLEITHLHAPDVRQAAPVRTGVQHVNIFTSQRRSPFCCVNILANVRFHTWMLRCYHASTSTHSPHSFMGAIEYIHICEAWLFLFSSHSTVLRDSIRLQTNRQTESLITVGFLTFQLPSAEDVHIWSWAEHHCCVFSGVIDVIIINPAVCAAIQRLVAGKRNTGGRSIIAFVILHPAHTENPPTILHSFPRSCLTCARGCAALLQGLVQKNRQELMGNPERIYIHEAFSKSGQNNNHG